MSQILTVDDRPLNRQFLASLLKYGGHSVVEAADGVETLALLRDSCPDLVITDISMPNMDGYEFVDHLRRQLKFATTPVIFYTASDNIAKAQSVADSFGVNGIITKPSEPEVILKSINAVLGREQLISVAAFSKSEESELAALRKMSLKLSALVELGLELSLERDSVKLLGRFCSTARHILGARKSMLGVLTEDGKDLKHFFINGLKEAQPALHEQPPVDHPVLQTIVAGKKTVRINHAESDLHLEQLSPYNSPISGLAGAPLISGDRVYGWLVLVEKQNGEDYSEEDERMIITLASAAATAYENAVFAELPQKNSEELDRTRREQLAMKDEFLSHVSHELRSPLSAMHQFTTILLDGIAGELNPDQREHLQIVLKNSLQLRDMISDLLDVTRAEGGKLTIAPRPIWLCDLFNTVIQTYERRAAEKGLSFRTARRPNLGRE